MLDGKPHEKGKVIWGDGTTLIGEFFNGKILNKDKVIVEFG